MSVGAITAAAILAAAPCAPSTNLEAMIDDSNSMQISDPSQLRIRAAELLMDTQGNERRSLGAIEFGTDAAPLFGPAVIGPSAAAFKAAMATGLRGDAGSTDYNDAFAAAAAHNPFATARIFLTDGEHTATPIYANGHAGGPPVYAIGLGVVEGSPAELLLRRIARDTRGLYQRADDASELQAAMFAVNSGITCQTPPKRFRDTFTKRRRATSHAVTVPRGTATAQFALTWTNAADAFTIGSFRVIRRGKVVARSARVRTIRVSRRRGPTFTVVRVRGLLSGKLGFSVKATRLARSSRRVTLTTQFTHPR